MRRAWARLRPWRGRVPTPEAVPESDDPYEVLGIAETATWREITTAHRRLAKQHHPDHSNHLSSADAIRRLNIAYVELRRRRAR